MLTSEQVAELKKQLTQQIQHLPEDRKAEAQEQIDALTEEDLEHMLQEQKSNSGKSPQAIFRSIVSGEIPAKKIEESKHAIAALDTKPISKGHTIIIPKKPVTNSKDLPSQIFNMAKKVSKRISKKLKAAGAEIQTEFKFGEIVLNIIPVYDKSLSLNSPRSDLEEKVADELHSLLKVVKKERKKVVKPQVVEKTLIKLKRRIP